MRAELKRLNNNQRLRVIEKHVLSENEFLVVNAIDGALFMDSTGMCYAIGVILDGRTCEAGDKGRGARYNSMATYICNINKNKERAAGVVFSEDKTIAVVEGKSVNRFRI